jgi:hypothetical protein
MIAVIELLIKASEEHGLTLQSFTEQIFTELSMKQQSSSNNWKRQLGKGDRQMRICYGYTNVY